MSIKVTLVRSVPLKAEIRALPVRSDRLGEEPYDIDWKLLEALGFEGKANQVQIVSSDGCPTAVVGMGLSAEVSAAGMRSASAALARAAKGCGWLASSLLDAVPEDACLAEFAGAHIEGLVLGSYGYHAYKSDPKPSKLKKVSVVSPSDDEVRKALVRGQSVAEAVCFARDLINEPGGSLTPKALAEAARRVAAQGAGDPLEVEVWDLKRIKKEKLGGLLGVNRGSEQEPRFVRLGWNPPEARGFLALVGKGITFDSGGLSIKPASGMETMKMDMSGAAAVLSAMKAVKTLRPSVRVEAFLPITDNMTGGDATRPGDVLRMRNGKTVEVLNTDAEGRLILADALSLASEAQPDAVIDLATLTGACMVALGAKVAGLMGNHDGWVEAVRQAAEISGERVWHLPLPADYRKQLDSEVADVKNIGNRWGGTLTAGLFLAEFAADGIPWAHLDIAGPAWAESAEDETTKGGTGFGVRLLLELIRRFEPPVS